MPLKNVLLQHLRNNTHFVKKKNNIVHLYNESAYTFKPHTCITIGFNAVVVTSLPAVCVLICNDLIHKLGLAYNINIMHTNDNYLHVTLYNYSNKTITLSQGQLYVTGYITMPGKPYFHFSV